MNEWIIEKRKPAAQRTELYRTDLPRDAYRLIESLNQIDHSPEPPTEYRLITPAQTEQTNA